MNSFFQKNSGQILPLALVMVLGAGVGTLSIEFAKRNGLAALTSDKAVVAQVAPVSQISVAHLATQNIASSAACGCDTKLAKRPLFRSGRALVNSAPSRVAGKRAGDCLQARNISAADPAEELAAISPYHEAQKLLGDIPVELNADPVVAAASGPTGAVGVPGPSGFTAAPAFASALFSDATVASSFGGGSSFVSADGPLSSMSAAESFGAPIVFAATSNPNSGSSGGNGGGSATAVVGETPPTVPEPSTLVLFALGMLCLAASRRSAKVVG